MGNTNAAIVTSHAVRDLKPAYVIMFGIAGGFQSEVGLGDVILPDKVFYCALGKQYTDQVQIRPEPLNIDAFLLESIRAYDYVRNNHKGRDYRVKFGPFAITEQVISSTTAAEEITKIHSKMVGVEMESFGVGLAIFRSLQDVKFVAVRGVSDHADEKKNDDYRTSALQNAADFLIGFLQSGWLPKNRHTESATRKYIAIQHLSRHLRPSVTTSARTFLANFAPDDLLEVVIDQTEFYKQGSFINPAEALHRQEEIFARLEEIQQEFPDHVLGYFGLAHIPLMFQLGFRINRREVQVFGNDYKTAAWVALPDRSRIPDVRIEGLPSQPIRQSGDVVMLMSVSYEINSLEPREIVSNALAFIHIHSERPKEGIVDSFEVLDAFTDAFREVREIIATPSVERIHLFYAGPPTLAFRCGQQINPNIDPDFIVYNYSRQDRPRYRWALNLQSSEIIIRE